MDAYKLLADNIFDMKVHYEWNGLHAPYVCMEKDRDGLAYVGDSYMEKKYVDIF